MKQNKTELIEQGFEKIDITKDLKKDPIFDQDYKEQKKMRSIKLYIQKRKQS